MELKIFDKGDHYDVQVQMELREGDEVLKLSATRQMAKAKMPSEHLMNAEARLTAALIVQDLSLGWRRALTSSIHLTVVAAMLDSHHGAAPDAPPVASVDAPAMPIADPVVVPPPGPCMPHVYIADSAMTHYTCSLCHHKVDMAGIPIPGTI